MARKGPSKTNWVGDPWDRQPKEPLSAYRAFCIYRDLPTWGAPGGRSIRRAYDTYRDRHVDKEKTPIPPKSASASPCKRGIGAPGQWTYWADLFRWRERAELYELEIERRARAEMMAEQVEARKRWVKEYKHLQGIGMAGILQKDLKDLKETPIRDLAKVVDTAIKGEMKVRGMDEVVVKVEARDLPGLQDLGLAEKEILARALLKSAGENPEVYGLLPEADEEEEEEEEDDGDVDEVDEVEEGLEEE